MFSNTYGECLLSVWLLNLHHFGRFWGYNPRFPSLFSVRLLTVQDTTSNEISHLHWGGLQSVLVGPTENEECRKL